jgi:hypothetical protein
MSRAIQITSIFEEIYGKLAIGYHRTDEGGLEALSKGKPYNLGKMSHGRVFGDGIYMTYDLKTQSDLEMFVFGNYLIKNKVNLEKYLILDYDVMKKVYRVNTVGEQLEKIFRLPRYMWDRVLGPRIVEKIKVYDSPSSRYTYTGDLAQTFSDEPQVRRWIRNNTRGMIFKESPTKGEGNVIMAFDPKSVTPIGWAYANSPSTTLNAKFLPVNSIAKETLNRPLTTPGGDYNERIIMAPYKSFDRQLTRSGYPQAYTMFTTKKTDTSKAMLTITNNNTDSIDRYKRVIMDLVKRNFIPYGWSILRDVYQESDVTHYVLLQAPRHANLPFIRIDRND